MDSRIVQMISDATTVVDRAFAAGSKYASDDIRLLIDPVHAAQPTNYKGVHLPARDNLGLRIPKAGRTCQFHLVVCLDVTRRDSPIYVVTHQGELCRARFVRGEVVLDHLDDGTVTWLASHVHATV